MIGQVVGFEKSEVVIIGAGVMGEIGLARRERRAVVSSSTTALCVARGGKRLLNVLNRRRL